MSIPRWLSGKESPAVQEPWVGSLHQEEPLAKEMVTHSSSLAWEVHGQRSLAGFSPWGCTELGQNLVTEHAHRQVSTGFSFKSLTALAPTRESACPWKLWILLCS